jgi:hypothetical protein
MKSRPIQIAYDCVVKEAARAASRGVKRNLKLIQLRTQMQFKFDTPAHTVFS